MKSTKSIGIGTFVNHEGEGLDPHHAHNMPIYQTSSFSFPDFASGAAAFLEPGSSYTYTRSGGPNIDLLESKLAGLEMLDGWSARSPGEPQQIAGAKVFASGMAAITSAILARVRVGEAVLSQRSLYGGTFGFLDRITERLGISVVTVSGHSADEWRVALADHPEVTLVYVETPSNPSMEIIDLEETAEIAHAHGRWMMVDNTFATPYCQRPLALGADVVVHSTTKYLSGHGSIVGGAVVSTHIDYIDQDLERIRSSLGGCASPFDTWLTNMGLRTFEVRMQRHISNAQLIAEFLSDHPKVQKVLHPGLESHPGHALAKRQMFAFGGMLSFELKGGLQAVEKMLNRLRLVTIGVSLGTTDSLIQYPAGMTHANVPASVREEMGISDGQVRISPGIENPEDIIADLEQALDQV